MGWTMKAFYVLAGVALLSSLVADVWTEPNYRLAGSIALIFVAALTTVFTILYVGRSRWWANRIGKVYAAKSVALAVVLVQAVVAVWWPGDYPYRYEIRWLVYALGTVVYVPMIVTLLREQRRARRR